MIEWCEGIGLGEDDYEAVKDVEIGPISHALSNARELIHKILLRTGADEYQIYLTGKGNYREEIATIKPYKGNRDSTHKPYHYNYLIRYLTENWGAITVEGIEADDIISINQYEEYIKFDPDRRYRDQPKFNNNTCIASIDKDLNMIPGWHYNWNKDEKYFIDEDTAITWFYCQLIMGDSTDNIVGVPGQGKTKAKQVLMNCENEEDMYWEVLNLYQAYYSTLGIKPMDALIENARLLYMLREPLKDDWSNLWKPPC